MEDKREARKFFFFSVHLHIMFIIYIGNIFIYFIEIRIIPFIDICYMNFLCLAKLEKNMCDTHEDMHRKLKLRSSACDKKGNFFYTNQIGKARGGGFKF